MNHTRVVVVLGGDPAERAGVTGGLLADPGRTALVLTGHPDAVDPRLDTSDEGPVEVRADDPTARLEAYRSGAADPDDDVLAALSAGGDTPLAAVLGWEYARRAAASGYWDVVVVELDGDLAAVRRIAAAGELAAFVESRWPANVRFASMAAGARADARVREAHRLALLAGDVAGFLAGPLEVIVVGRAPERTAAMAALARGAVRPEVAPDGAGGYRVEYPVPTPPSAPASVEGDRLRLEHDGFRATLGLPPLLTRCVLVDSTFDADAGRVRLRFLPDPDLWPQNLVPSGSAGTAG
ncbi:hypothetical protein M3B38_09865 [Dietzia cinnamea]|uniref:hypothetical protein n=1 Tax=Dietzia TaxID=37914 RepID=UPI000D0890DE|nr:MULTISPECIES: hypothetical protein [Dietzia]AVM64990.1 hypothetical protein C3V38_12065 [Dietzia sp. oral taxon 368]MCT1712276.1 hypothetical protein [Dietzia cinnamea]